MLHTIIQTIALIFYENINIYIFSFLAQTFIGITGGLSMTSIIASAIIVDDSRSLLNSVFFLNILVYFIFIQLGLCAN